VMTVTWSRGAYALKVCKSFTAPIFLEETPSCEPGLLILFLSLLKLASMVAQLRFDPTRLPLLRGI